MIDILLVEDDISLNKIVRVKLQSVGYNVTSCFDGEEAIEVFEVGNYSLVISDIMMPKLDGYALARLIRATNKCVPIIFMTAREDVPSQIKAFSQGIDDYITKPFDMEVLLARISALLRRAGIVQSKMLEVGNLRMDSEEHMAYVDGRQIALTVREFDLLFKLLSYPKKTFTRTQLMNEFWDYDTSATSRTVDVYMAKIREKTVECTGFDIVTVHGLGYKAVLK